MLNWSKLFPGIPVDLESLVCPFTANEIKMMIFSMAKNKSSGPDSLFLPKSIGTSSKPMSSDSSLILIP